MTIKKHLMPFTLILFFAFQVNAATLTQKQEEVYAKEVEDKVPVFAEDCVASSELIEDYHQCILSHFRNLVVKGNTMGSIAIIGYLLEIGRDNEAYDWYVYAVNSNLSKSSKIALKFQFTTLAKKFKSNNP
tara:strand:- start:32399 stop:32791 length:393 start_codon:yes stop_codon:yes gene_type:complete